MFIKSEIDSTESFNIKLSWNFDSLSNYYEIYKKTNIGDETESEFELVNNSSKLLNYFVDYDVENNLAYEYLIINQRQLDDTTTRETFGYIYTGSNIKIEEYLGKVLLLVDKTVYYDIKKSLDTFQLDLIGDGYLPEIIKVPRAEEFDAKKVVQTKEIIREKYNKYGNEIKSIILIGRVPVPYSGEYTIDGHYEENYGAWPSDVFYSDLNGLWTDYEVNVDSAEWEWHWNLPYDGKYDNTYVAEKSLFEMGRIDFYNMPLFKESEVELLKRYFYKNHKYRTGVKKYKINAIIDDKWGAFYGPMAGSVWSNYISLMDSSEINEKGLIDNLGNTEYLFTYGGASGATTSISKTAYAELYATRERKSIFVEFFGSRLVDWDTENNLLRAAIASNPSILVSYFGVRPAWNLQYMGLGKNIGFSAKRTQNNTYEEYPNSVSFGQRVTHINLMGDPTIKMHIVSSVSELDVDWDTEFNQVEITWKKPNEDDIIGYDIYRSESLDSKFKKINNEIIITENYIDKDVNQNLEYQAIYMVRVIKITKTVSGSFYNYSCGEIALPKNRTGLSANEKSNDIFLYPNPNNGKIKFNKILNKVELYNLNSELIYVVENISELDLTDLGLTKGIYFIKIDNKNYKKVIFN